MYGNINNCSLRETADEFFAGGKKKNALSAGN
jgi:hypothetical protein